MLNPIRAIKLLYQLENHPEPLGVSRAMIEQNEQALGVQLPAGLYHYTKPNNYSIAHFRAVRDLMVSTCLAKLHQA